MLTLEIKLLMQGKEVSVDSFVEAILGQVRSSISEEISRTLNREQIPHRECPQADIREMSRQAVSVREAARLLSISQRTVDKYVALKVIRTIRIGRRVLVPMKSLSEVVSKGIP